MTKVLGSRGRRWLVEFLVRDKCKPRLLSIPRDFVAARSILIVLPEDSLEALYQIPTVVSIASSFNKRCVILLCEATVAPFFRRIQGVSSVEEYERSERYLFSEALGALSRELAESQIDICVFLERSPEISLLHLVGRIGAKVRMAYYGAAAVPFFNVHVKPSRENTYMADRNILMAEVLGVRLHRDIRWSVSKNMLTEIAHMIHEAALPDGSPLAGIDVQFMYYSYGRVWTDALVDRMTATGEPAWYLYVHGIPDQRFLKWLQSRDMPVFSSLSPSRVAALVYKSDLIVSGASTLFRLADLLRRPAIGVFEESVLRMYCRLTPRSVGIAYTGSPDNQTIDRLCENVVAISGSVARA